ncbi:response regulator, partial [Paenibacillus sp. 598K]|uniref:response regulator n=1 Tax=Paenibacillus sp. 598K TaxID=1117987 RepID=UPI001627BEED
MYRYVVIDDETLIRRAIVKKIASLGLPLAWVGEAEDGEEGLELALREMPDLVFTDMRMPAMDGVSLLRELSERQPQMALIVISGYSDFEYTREAIGANVVDYILKPFDNRELRASLDKALAFLQRQTAQREAEHAHALAVEGERLAAWLCRSCADERAPLRAEQYGAEPIRALLAAESLAVGVLAAAEAPFDVGGSETAYSGRVGSGTEAESRAVGVLAAAAASPFGVDGAGMLWLPHPERPEVRLLLVGTQSGAGQLVLDRLRRMVAAAERAGDGALAAASRACGRPEALRAA